MNTTRHVKVLDVGTPKLSCQEWLTTEVRYHGYKSLPSEKSDEGIRSPEFTCFGHKWCLEVYSGGHTSSKDGQISVFLRHLSEGCSIEVDFGFSVIGPDNKEILDLYSSNNLQKATFAPKGDSTNKDIQGVANFIQRSKIDGRYVYERTLVAEALVVAVRMRSKNDGEPLAVPFIPENPICNMILKMFMDEESADVVFEVEDGGKQIGKSRKRAKISPTKFHAHRAILKQCAPDLAEMCGSKSEALTSVPVTDVKPDSFRHMLYYIYGGKLTEEEFKSDAKDIIDVADRFGIVNLKLEAEVWYVKSVKIEVDNVMDFLLYAHAKNLALVKEATMDFIVENRVEVLDKVSLKNVPGDLFADLLAATTRGMEKDSNGGGGDLSAMRISELRRKANGSGLSFDGSRETLIAALKENTGVGKTA